MPLFKSKPKQREINPQLQSLILLLPGELRNLLYSYILFSDRQTPRLDLRTLKRPTVLAATCRLLEHEIYTYLFHHAKFAYTILIDHDGKLHDRLDTRTKRFLKGHVWGFGVRDVMFRVEHPDVRPRCRCGAPRTRGAYLNWYYAFDFLGVVGESGPFITSRRAMYPTFQAKGNWKGTIRAFFTLRGLQKNWEDISRLTEDGLQVHSVEEIGQIVKSTLRLRWLKARKRDLGDQMNVVHLKVMIEAWSELACRIWEERMGARRVEFPSVGMVVRPPTDVLVRQWVNGFCCCWRWQ